jgi:hypothetical protein
MVFFKADIKDLPKVVIPSGYFVLKVTRHNIHKWPDILDNCIKRFYDVLDWDDMWNKDDGEERLNQGCVLFVYFKNGDFDNPIGYAWYDGNWMFNVFMHPSRPKGHTALFTLECCHSLDPSIKTVECRTDDWNIKAQKLYEKVGFTRLSS